MRQLDGNHIGNIGQAIEYINGNSGRIESPERWHTGTVKHYPKRSRINDPSETTVNFVFRFWRRTARKHHQRMTTASPFGMGQLFDGRLLGSANDHRSHYLVSR